HREVSVADAQPDEVDGVIDGAEQRPEARGLEPFAIAAPDGPDRERGGDRIQRQAAVEAEVDHRTSPLSRRVRAGDGGSARRMRRRSRPSRSAVRPIDGGTTASSFRRSAFASDGLWPPVETAITTGPRRRTDGTMKLQSSGTSTTLTGIARFRQAAKTARLTFRSSVAAITSTHPATSPARKRRGTRRTRSRPSAGVNVGLTIVTVAPARRSARAFWSATEPPPTTRQGSPFTFSING